MATINKEKLKIIVITKNKEEFDVLLTTLCLAQYEYKELQKETANITFTEFFERIIKLYKERTQ